MRRLTGLSCLLTVVFAASAAAQEIPQFGGSRDVWGPRLDSIALTFATRAIWQGHDIGSPAGRAWMDIAIWGRPVAAAGNWGFSVRPYAVVVPDPGVGTLSGTRLGGEVAIERTLGDEDAIVTALTDYYFVLDDGRGGGDFAWGLRLRGVPIPWLPEIWPTIDAAVMHDEGRFDGTHATLGLTEAFGIGRIALWMVGRVHADSYGPRDFGYRAFEAGLGGSIDLGGSGEILDPGAGPFKLRADVSLLKRRAAGVAGWAAIGLIYMR